MPVNYPSFMADPNAVPKMTGPSDLLTNIARGYQIANAPKQMQLANQLKQAQLTGMQQQNAYYPRMQEQSLAEGQQRLDWTPKLNQSTLDAQSASTDYTKTQNRLAPATAQANINQSNAAAGLTTEQAKAARTSRLRDEAFFNILSGGAGGNAGAPSPAPSTGGPSYLGGGTPAPGATNAGAPSANAATGSAAAGGSILDSILASDPNAKVTNPGNSGSYNIDELYMKYPQYRKQFEDQGYKIKTDNQVNPTTGQLMTITTLPSGRQISTSAQVGPGIEDQAFQKQIGTDRAAAYKKYTDAFGSNVQLQNNVSQLKDILQNPDFVNAVGPANAALNRVMGNGNAGKLTGEIGVLTGNMQAAVANTLGTQAPKARLAMAKLLKADPTDPADVFAGKLVANDVLTKWMGDYNSYMASAIRDGKSEDEALKSAPKSLGWDKYEREIESRVNTGKLASQLRDRGAAIQYKDATPYVKVPSADGQGAYVPVSNYNQYMADYNKKMQGAK
jgi:hypothetical protein